MREIIFYEYEQKYPSSKVYHGYIETMNAIDREVPFIKTTQMGLLSTKLFNNGYDIFIENDLGVTYKVELGSSNGITGKKITIDSDIFKLYKSGEFNY